MEAGEGVGVGILTLERYQDLAFVRQLSHLRLKLRKRVALNRTWQEVSSLLGISRDLVDLGSANSFGRLAGYLVLLLPFE